ncbi:hypothetical protein GIB67_033116 [Kingdonia uniflora]|uniref:Uncharacterized protein n=1 Tax=Kingdonia uniflora TaxID=39325 RepID=A0A7J7MZ46_9MAGN|nr:hypothetical protein GIB67_033116 [Kingdonia uniflora]
MKEETVDKIRGVVRDCVSKHLYSSAIFFADKIVLHDLRFRYLAAKCLKELKEWDQCLLMLGEAKIDEHGNILNLKDCHVMDLDKDGEDHEINISSAIFFLGGKAYEALENRTQALQWYKAAVKADPLCYEALECLIDNHMLTCEEEIHLSHTPFKTTLICWHAKLNTTISVVNTKSALKCTLVLLATAMELGHSNELYLMACNLVRDYPQKALSWFAVGCYYYCIKKYDQSWRYFSKVTSLDGTFLPARLGHGNAFAAQEEGDQAMPSFHTAARLFPGCHLPTLYIGMEYMRTHSYKLAEQFFLQAKKICPSDPLVYNELGVVAYHMKENKKAVCWFEKTLAHVPSSFGEMWEPTVVNLAHALRKLKRYNEAIHLPFKG